LRYTLKPYPNSSILILKARKAVGRVYQVWQEREGTFHSLNRLDGRTMYRGMRRAKGIKIGWQAQVLLALLDQRKEGEGTRW
jgi:hypothetical protein